MLFIHKELKQTLHIGDLLLKHPHLDADNLILPDDYAEVLNTPKPLTEADEVAEAIIQEVNNEYVVVWTIRKMTQVEQDNLNAYIKQRDDELQQRIQRSQISTEPDTSDLEITIEPVDIVNTTGSLIITNNEEQE